MVTRSHQALCAFHVLNRLHSVRVRKSHSVKSVTSDAGGEWKNELATGMGSWLSHEEGGEHTFA